jgi:GntR family transcriptional regulator
MEVFMDKRLDNMGVARYLVVKDEILAAIRRGDLLENGQLPSEDKLSELYGVSRTTIRSALQSLSDEGIIVKKHGIGNFVQPQRHVMSTKCGISLMSFTENATATLKECEVKVVPASDRIAKKLCIRPGETILVIDKVLLSNGLKSSIIKEHFPFGMLSRTPNAAEVPNSIYDFPGIFCGRKITRVISGILPIRSGQSPFDRANGPCLKFEEVFLDEHKNRVAYSDLFMNTNVIRPQIIRE